MIFKSISDQSIVEADGMDINLEQICTNVEKFYQQEFWKLQEIAHERSGKLSPELIELASDLLTKMREMTTVNDKLDKYIQENHNKDFSLPAH